MFYRKNSYCYAVESITTKKHINQVLIRVTADIYNSTVYLRFNIAYQTARTDLIVLARFNYLSEKLMGKKILYFKSETFDDKMERLKYLR